MIADREVEGTAGVAPAVVKSSCWGGAVLLFGTITTGSMVTAGVLVIGRGQAVLVKAWEKLLLIRGTLTKVAINLNKTFHPWVRRTCKHLQIIYIYQFSCVSVFNLKSLKTRKYRTQLHGYTSYSMYVLELFL